MSRQRGFDYSLDSFRAPDSFTELGLNPMPRNTGSMGIRQRHGTVRGSEGGAVYYSANDAYSRWSSRLRILNRMRTELYEEPDTDDVANSLEACIYSVSKHMESNFFLENSVDIAHLNGEYYMDPSGDDEGSYYDDYDAENDYYPSDMESTQCVVVPSDGRTTVEDKLPGLAAYSMEKIIGSMEGLDIGKQDVEEIADTMITEANGLMYHFDKALVQKLYSRKWMNRVKLIDEVVKLLDDDSIMKYNDNSVQQVVTGVGRILSRLCSDHALKVLVKNLELLDAFFDFMMRNECCALSSARPSTTRNNAVSCGLEFIEVLIGRLADRLSAVVNTAICALLKVAESDTIPTYEDVVNCILRSIGSSDQHPLTRSLCNRLRLMTTLLFRSQKYNSHNMARLSVKPQHFYDRISQLYRHSHGEVRHLATEALAVGFRVYFKDASIEMEAAIKEAISKIHLPSISLIKGEAEQRIEELLSEVKATWNVNILRSRKGNQ